jgi:hypothetical protein
VNRTLLRNGTLQALRLLACGVFVTALAGCEGQIIGGPPPNPQVVRSSWLSYKYPANCKDCPELTDRVEEFTYYCSIEITGGSFGNGGESAGGCEDPFAPAGDLSKWKRANGFPHTGRPDAHAIYGNLGDLRIGRDMNCVTSANGNIACYVTNYGPPPFDQAIDGVNPVWLGVNNFPRLGAAVEDARAGTAPFATVAMVWNKNAAINRLPNAVTFYAFDRFGLLLERPALDGEGGKTTPRMCMACHGGTYDSATHSVTGAQFLPFDPFYLQHSSQAGYRFEDQEQQERYRKLNELVNNTLQESLNEMTPPASAIAIAEFINGTYNNAVHIEGTPPNGNYVPPGWSDDIADEAERRVSKNLYNSVYRQYCRMCHMASATAPFLTFKAFGDAARVIEEKVCHSTDMPNAQVPFVGFWQDLVAQKDLREFLTGKKLPDLHSCQ